MGLEEKSGVIGNRPRFSDRRHFSSTEPPTVTHRMGESENGGEEGRKGTVHHTHTWAGTHTHAAVGSTCAHTPPTQHRQEGGHTNHTRAHTHARTRKGSAHAQGTEPLHITEGGHTQKRTHTQHNTHTHTRKCVCARYLSFLITILMPAGRAEVSRRRVPDKGSTTTCRRRSEEEEEG